MPNSANRIEALQERNAERAKKADQYTVEQPAASRARAQTHTKLGNAADTTITAAGSKTLGMVTGGAWGLLKGTFIGILTGGVGMLLLSGLLVQPFAVCMLATMFVSMLAGCRSGYYRAEMNYSAKAGKKAGDKIAAEGNAQAPKIKEKINDKAVEMAEKELPEKTAAEMQTLDHRTGQQHPADRVESPTHHQDLVKRSRATAPSQQGPSV